VENFRLVDNGSYTIIRYWLQPKIHLAMRCSQSRVVLLLR
jgi:hypothetical protein